MRKFDSIFFLTKRAAYRASNPPLVLSCQLFDVLTITVLANFSHSYERILRRLERSLVSKQWDIVRKLLGWMVCAKRPLKWREIQAAVSIDPNEQTVDFDSRSLRSSVEEYCGSLIQVLSGDRVELVHTTAKL